MDGTFIFRDREDAGRRLAERLKNLELRDPVVLGIPRGGVIIAAALARELGGELDVILVRKLRAPAQPELAIGAISEEGDVMLNPFAEMVPGFSDDYVQGERQERLEELSQRAELFREVRPPAPLTRRSVILTDDGIATGSTMLAAIEVVRSKNPHEIILAVPVAPPDRLEEIARHCDRTICLQTPASFIAIGQFYEQFEQVEDDEVRELLREFAPATR